jgi:leucyl aminopeptidase (aminopeptidase T)
MRPPPSLRGPASKRPSGALLLAPIDYDLANAARRIVEGALGVAGGDSVAIIVDEARHQLGATLAEMTRVVGGTPLVVELEESARPAHLLPEAVRQTMRSAQASILLIGFHEGELGMRLEVAMLVKELGLRHAHMVGVTRASMLTGFSVDPVRILDATRAVRTRLRPSSVLRLRTLAGSDLEIKLDPANRWAEHVGVIRPGRWENLPAGELMTSPADVHGVFVCDASIGAHFGQAAGLLADRPISFEIEGGLCKRVRSSDHALQREVEAFLRAEHFANRVGTVSLGTNVGILAPIGDILCDQNLPGLHLGFGSPIPEQTGANWNARSQVTAACAHADVDLDGAPLLRRGRYLVA